MCARALQRPQREALDDDAEQRADHDHDQIVTGSGVCR